MVYRKPSPPMSALAIKMADADRAVVRADRAALQRRRAYFEIRGSFANEMARAGEREMLTVDPASDLAAFGRDALAAWRAAAGASAMMVDAIDAFLAAGGGSHAEFESMYRAVLAGMALADDRLAHVAARAGSLKAGWPAAAKEWARNGG